MSPLGENRSAANEKGNKLCQVCGDCATGYNFNVITCESCKAFFRRNALRPKEFKCPYSGACDINVASRRFCQKCRLQKSFSVGMKKEWILKEEQLKKRKNWRRNRLKSQDSGSASPAQLPSPTPAPNNPASTADVTKSIVHLPNDGDDLNETVTLKPGELIELVNEMSARRRTDRQCRCVCQCTARKTVKVEEEAKSEPNYQLNAAEQRSLDEVRCAFSVLNEPLDDTTAVWLTKTKHNPTDILNIMDITMRRLVRMAKNLPAFHELANETKLALLKGGMMDMLTMRGVTRFDLNQGCWTTPVVSERYHIPFSIFDQLRYEQRDCQKALFVRFLSIMEEDVRTDELAIDLVVLLALFDKERDGVSPSDFEIIAKHNRFYRHLLRRYLESVHGRSAQHKYWSVMSAISVLPEVSETSLTLFLGTVDPGRTKALPKQFFKLQ